MNIILSFLVFLFFCIDYGYIYYNTKYKNKTLSESQRAYIMSIKASITLFLLGLVANVDFFYFKENFESNSVILNLGILNLIAYFFMDCIIGYYEYHKYLCGLSGYFHHIIYLVISVLSIKFNVMAAYTLFFVEELPTFILSIGHFNSYFRSDNLFGLTFFITRIIYHLFLMMKTFKLHILFPILGLLAFGLHTFWFKNWLNKYYINKREKKE